MSYQEEYQRSIEQPEAFWREKASALSWYKQPETILATDDNGIPRWFVDGELNTCYLALDSHIEQGRGEQAALIYDSPVTQSRRQYSYNELRDEVAVFAGALAGLGVGKGDGARGGNRDVGLCAPRCGALGGVWRLCPH